MPIDIKYLLSLDKHIYWTPLGCKFNFLIKEKLDVSNIKIEANSSLFFLPILAIKYFEFSDNIRQLNSSLDIFNIFCLLSPIKYSIIILLLILKANQFCSLLNARLFIEFKDIPIQNLYSNLCLFSFDSLLFSFAFLSLSLFGKYFAENNNLSFILISFFSYLYKLS